MKSPPRQHDRRLGVACLVACPAISGLFLGAVAIVALNPNGGGHALSVAGIVAALAFVANGLAICAVAVASEYAARQRARRAVDEVFDLARESWHVLSHR